MYLERDTVTEPSLKRGQIFGYVTWFLRPIML